MARGLHWSARKRTSPELHAIARESGRMYSAKIRAAIARLPPGEKVVAAKVLFEKKSPDQIAGELQITIDEVNARLARAQSKLGQAQQL